MTYVDEYVPSFYGFDGFRPGLRASDFELGKKVPGVPLPRPISGGSLRRARQPAASQHHDRDGAGRSRTDRSRRRVRRTRSRGCRRSVACPARSRRRPSRRFCSRSGCRSNGGTASSPASATAAGQASFRMGRWPNNSARLCSGLDEHGPRGGARSERGEVRVRQAGTTDRLRLPRSSRDGSEGEGARRGVVRQAGGTSVLHRLFVGRLRRPDGSAALPSRLQRHRRRHAGEQLDAAHGWRPRRDRWRSFRIRQSAVATALGVLHARRIARAMRSTASSTACWKIRASASSIRRRCRAVRIRIRPPV